MKQQTLKTHLLFVSALLLITAISSVAEAGPRWGDQCKTFFSEITRICDVYAEVPGAAEACDSLNDASDQIQMAAKDDATALLMEEGCKNALPSLTQAEKAWKSLKQSISPALPLKGDKTLAEGSQDGVSDWGEECKGYFSEVRMLCAAPPNAPGADVTCKAWLDGVGQMEKGIPLGSPAQIFTSMEQTCKQSREALSQVSKAWGK